MQEEIWKDIPNYEGHYQVSNLGRVKSLKHGKEKLKSIFKKKDGYYGLNLYKNNKHKNAKIHRLVAIAFLNHDYQKTRLVVDHINNKKDDNRLENLQLITYRENSSKDKKGWSSKYVGVSWHAAANKWSSHIRFKEKNIYLGVFKNEIDASNAYQRKLKEILETIEDNTGEIRKSIKIIAY